MDLPKRKRIRLPEYDYSSPGAYFVTICTQDRKCILSSITVGAAISRPPEVRLTRYGEIVDLAIRNIPSVYPNVSVDHSVIMPNHVHLILRICDEESGRQIAAPTVSSVIGQMKRWASIQAKTTLWQKSFHEHVIRGERDLPGDPGVYRNEPRQMGGGSVFCGHGAHRLMPVRRLTSRKTPRIKSGELLIGIRGHGLCGQSRRGASTRSVPGRR